MLLLNVARCVVAWIVAAQGSETNYDMEGAEKDGK